MRSSPHDGGFDWTSASSTAWFCWTKETAGFFDSRSAWARLISAAKPRNAFR